MADLERSAKATVTSLVQSAALWLITTTVVSFKANAVDAGLHRKAKVAHFLCVSFIILFHCTAIRMIGWAFRNPDRILPTFYVVQDLFPAWATLFVWVLNTSVSVGAMVVGFGLARRKERSRAILLRLLPLFVVVDWIEAFKGAMAQPRSFAEYSAIGGLLALATVVPYFLIALFYTRRSVAEQLFMKAPNQSPQRNAGSRPFSGDLSVSAHRSSHGPRG